MTLATIWTMLANYGAQHSHRDNLVSKSVGKFDSVMQRLRVFAAPNIVLLCSKSNPQSAVGMDRFAFSTAANRGLEPMALKPESVLARRN